MAQTVLITGGTKGIGFAAAQEMAASGYNLILTYSSDENAAHASQQLLLNKYENVTVDILKADVSQVSSLDTISEFIQNRKVQLAGIIFNAGLTHRKAFEEINLAEWEQVFFANIHFPVFLLKALLPHIQKGGCVLFTGSMMGIYPHGMSLAYGVTKSGVHALVQNLVKFLEPYQIRVNAIAPGFVDTEWQKNKPMEIRRNIENKIAEHRFCEPSEIGEVYQFIFSHRYFNGEIITVSGGYCYK